MSWENSLYVIAVVGAPIFLGFTWWGWLQNFHRDLPKWRAILFSSGLCAGTANLVLWWAWVIWLRLHYNATSWGTRDVVSDLGFILLTYSLCTAIVGTGRYRILLGLSSVLAVLPWLPAGVL